MPPYSNANYIHHLTSSEIFFEFFLAFSGVNKVKNGAKTVPILTNN